MIESDALLIANNCTSLIRTSCQLLKVRTPHIYYIKEDKNEFILRDQNYNIISYDRRDAGYNVKSALFILKEYTLYINVNIFTDVIRTYALVLRQTRAIFQLREVKLYVADKKAYNRKYNASVWMYVFEQGHNNQDAIFDSPVEMDRNAYSCVIINYLFNEKITYLHKDNAKNAEKLEDLIKRIEDEYNVLDVLEVASKNNVVCNNLKRLNLKYLQE